MDDAHQPLGGEITSEVAVAINDVGQGSMQAHGPPLPRELSPVDCWQLWRNTPDADVGRLLRLVTDLPAPEIERLVALQGQGLSEAKTILATEATALVHGREAAEKAAAIAQRTPERGVSEVTPAQGLAQANAKLAMGDAQTGPARVSETASGPLPGDRSGIDISRGTYAPAQVQQIRPPTQEEALVHPVLHRPDRRWRFGSVAAGLVAMLGLGWVGGIETRRFVDFAEISTWFEQKAVGSAHALTSAYEALRRQVVSRFEGPASGADPAKVAGAASTAATPDINAAFDRVLSSLDAKLDQVRDASDGAARDLGLKIEQVRTATERARGELAPKLGQLEERLGRIERQLTRQSSAAKAAPLARQPNGKALTRATLGPIHRPASGAEVNVTRKPVPTWPGIEQQIIEDWTVRAVSDGRAVLDGPEGRIAVSPGDKVPGVGRVQTIVRRGSDWLVVTNKGVITTD